jgi:hypothetical protein
MARSPQSLEVRLHLVGRRDGRLPARRSCIGSLVRRSCTSRSFDRSLLLFDRRRRQRGVEPPATQGTNVAVCSHQESTLYWHNVPPVRFQSWRFDPLTSGARALQTRSVKSPRVSSTRMMPTWPTCFLTPCCRATDEVLSSFESEVRALSDPSDEHVSGVVERVVLAPNAVNRDYQGAAYETASANSCACSPIRASAKPALMWSHWLPAAAFLAMKLLTGGGGGDISQLAAQRLGVSAAGTSAGEVRGA